MTKQQTIDDAVAGKGCLGRSMASEPVFVLCGRDAVSGDVIRQWADLREARAHRLGLLDGDEKAKIAEARAHALQMDAWPKKRV